MIKIMISFVILFPVPLIYVYNNQVDWEPAIAIALGQGLGAWIAAKNLPWKIKMRRLGKTHSYCNDFTGHHQLFNLYTYFI